jgi:hypothetical protein
MPIAGFNSVHNRTCVNGADRHWPPFAPLAPLLHRAASGRRPLPDHYDDGKISGGALDRPDLQHLLAEFGYLSGCNVVGRPNDALAWKPYGDHGTDTHLAFDPDPAAMKLDEFLYQGQAESSSFVLA